MTELPRFDGAVHPAVHEQDALPEPPWWWRSPSSTARLPRPAWIACPNGHLRSLDPRRVQADGGAGRVDCLHQGCSFSDDVRLVGWAP